VHVYWNTLIEDDYELIIEQRERV